MSSTTSGDEAVIQDDRLAVRKAVRRAARRLVPLLFVLYFVNYLDRVAISFAGPNGMNTELGLTATMFGVAAGVFFIGYILLEVPSNLALHRFGARKWLARIVLTWGVVASATAFAPNIGVLVAMRFLLGLAEAGFLPGIILYLTYWFPAMQRKRITALFFTAVPISSALGAIISTAIIQYGHGLFGMSGWRVMFLLTGVPAVVLTAAVWFFLTDRPADAKWMPKDERDALAAALRDEQAHTAATGPVSIRKALTSPRVFALGWVYFGITYGVYALGFFLPTIIAGFQKQFGVTYSTPEKGLITAIPYVTAVFAMVLWSRRAGSQTSQVAIPAIVAGISIPIALYLGSPFTAMLAVTVCACGALCAIPAFWALPTAYLGGAAAAAGIGLINSLGNLSGFLAPYATGFLSDATGNNRTGMWIVGMIVVSASVVTIVLGRKRPDAQVPILQMDTTPTHDPLLSTDPSAISSK